MHLVPDCLASHARSSHVPPPNVCQTSMGSPKALESGSFKGSEAPAGGEPPAGDDVRRTGTRLTAVAHIVTAGKARLGGWLGV